MIEAGILRVDGAMTILYDAAIPAAGSPQVFCAEPWRRQGSVLDETTGRGSVLVLDRGNDRWVLRHYNRGGFVSRFIQDHQVWSGLERTRAFREWRLLAKLRELRLPAPRPIAARVVHRGLLYQADIITAYLPGTRPLSAFLNEGRPLGHRWRSIGRMVRAFHDSGVDHPDLTAHNILLDSAQGVFLVDFDNARLRPPGRWCEAGLARLQRSLRKVALETGTRFDIDAWEMLEDGYRTSA